MSSDEVGSKRSAESEAGVPPPRKKKKKSSSKKSGISSIAALAQQQQAQKVERSTTGGGSHRGGARKLRTFKEGFDPKNYVLVNRPKGPKSNTYTDCELHLWNKERYESTPANKRMTPPKDYAAFPLPPARVVSSFLLGGVGMNDANWNPTHISGWTHTMSLDYSKDQDPVPEQYAEDAWAKKQPAEAAEAGDILEAFQDFLADSARQNSIRPGVPPSERAFPSLIGVDGQYKSHVDTRFIVDEMRLVKNDGKVECTLCIHKNADGKRIVKIKTQAYYEFRNFEDWVTAMELSPAEKKLYLQAATDDDRKSQLKAISKARGVPVDKEDRAALHAHLSEDVTNRDLFAMAYGYERVLFDLKEPRSPYKMAQKELRDAQDAYKAACDELHDVEMVSLEQGRSADQDLREAKIAKSRADSRVKRARRSLEIASQDKGKKEWRTVENCREIQKTKDIVHYGDYVSPMVKVMGARSYSGTKLSTYIYMTTTILHIASRPKHEIVLPDMIEGAHAVNEDSDEEDLMEDEDAEEANGEDEDGLASDASDDNLPGLN